ncbi:MAG: ABC transporter permease, partial [Flammeovirgaceae bacterium]
MADSSIFNVLSFDFIEGNPSALQEPNTIVLSESLASKVFGPDFRNKTDLIGTIVEIDNVDFNVSGIIQDVPYNSHLIPSALISWTGLGSEDIWDDSQAYTYARLGANVNHEDLDKKLQKFADQNEHIIESAERFGAKVQIYSQDIADIHLQSHKQYEVSINANWTNIYIYILMGVFFILACSTNYLNLSLALSINRFKEVGIRKILGSTNQQLRTQLFAESFFVIVSSFALSLLLFYLLLPSFGSLLNYKLTADILLDTRFILTALAIMTVVVAVSGIVPALSLSRLNPIQIVKAKYSQSRDRFPLRKVLIVFQFILATSMLTTVLAMSRQVDFL